MTTDPDNRRRQTESAERLGVFAGVVVSAVLIAAVTLVSIWLLLRLAAWTFGWCG